MHAGALPRERVAMNVEPSEQHGPLITIGSVERIRHRSTVGTLASVRPPFADDVERGEIPLDVGAISKDPTVVTEDAPTPEAVESSGAVPS